MSRAQDTPPIFQKMLNFHHCPVYLENPDKLEEILGQSSDIPITDDSIIKLPSQSTFDSIYLHLNLFRLARAAELTALHSPVVLATISDT